MQSDNTQYKVEVNDLPELYSAANTASLRAQRNHLLILKGYLSLLVVGSLLTVYEHQVLYAPQLAIFVFLATLSLTVWQVIKRFDKVWYNGRAVAESVKTRSWRFMMRAEPFESIQNENIVRASFRSELKEILRENKDLGAHLESDQLGDSVTDKMSVIRGLERDLRLEIYKVERIEDQRNWYAIKAGKNKKAGNIWFGILVVVHVFIIIFLIIKITLPDLLLPADSLIVIAGGIVTWVQIKRYHDLSTSYMLTAREIGIIKGDSENVNSDEQLSNFVKDAENAFSREHTQWFARKDN